MLANMRIYADPELKEIIGKAADALSIPLSEYVVRIMAEHFHRPDLAKIPRKPPGRRRSKFVAGR